MEWLKTRDVEAIETVIDDLNAAIDNLVEQKAKYPDK